MAPGKKEDAVIVDRTTRVQGAIVHGTSLLLIQHREHDTGRSYWLLPGGSPMEGESDDVALRREILEETHLLVDIERLLFEDQSPADPVYRRFRTFLCRWRSGRARPGAEPEVEVASVYAIAAVRWLDLSSEATWDAGVRADRWTYPLLQRIQTAVGLNRRR